MVPRGVLCDISLILDSEKKHTTMISVKLSTWDLICNYKHMGFKMNSDSE